VLAEICSAPAKWIRAIKSVCAGAFAATAKTNTAKSKDVLFIKEAFVCQMRGRVSSFQFSAFGSENLKLETENAIGFHPVCPSFAHF
jgi:hypothetical protein